MINLQLGDVGHIIQLSVAPVFLLTGVGTNLTVLTNRLARIIDRSRKLEERPLADYPEAQQTSVSEELTELHQRAHLINRAITLSTSCALFVCLVIASLFLADAINLQLDKLVAGLFVLGIFSLIGSLLYLLREVFVATKTLRRQRLQGLRTHR